MKFSKKILVAVMAMMMVCVFAFSAACGEVTPAITLKSIDATKVVARYTFNELTATDDGMSTTAVAAIDAAGNPVEAMTGTLTSAVASTTTTRGLGNTAMDFTAGSISIPKVDTTNGIGVSFWGKGIASDWNAMLSVKVPETNEWDATTVRISAGNIDPWGIWEVNAFPAKAGYADYWLMAMGEAEGKIAEDEAHAFLGTEAITAAQAADWWYYTYVIRANGDIDMYLNGNLAYHYANDLIPDGWETKTIGTYAQILLQYIAANGLEVCEGAAMCDDLLVTTALTDAEVAAVYAEVSAPVEAK